MKIFLDDVKLSFTPRAIWLTLYCLWKFTLDLIRELRRDREFYKYEWTAGDWEEERNAALNESQRHISKEEGKYIPKL